MTRLHFVIKLEDYDENVVQKQESHYHLFSSTNKAHTDKAGVRWWR